MDTAPVHLIALPYVMTGFVGAALGETGPDLR